ncbi:CU044_5270 family protein [Microtetraspora malaysiensis]|uniref:CU044_5270 family protein n=1 Tax=Microtetraspora malaysiensis TaxID=161358 RepID=UPI003D94AA59
MDELHDGQGSRPLVEPRHVDAVVHLLGSHEPPLDAIAEGRSRLLAEATATTTVADLEPMRKRRRGRLVGVGLSLAMAAAVAVIAPAMLSDSTISIVPQPGTSSATAEPTARQILLAAAVAAEKERASGDYWRTTTVTQWMLTDPTRSYVIEANRSRESWLAERPELRSWWIDQYRGAKPATPQDEAAWRAAGAPTGWRYPKDMNEQLFAVPSEPLTAAAGERSATRLRGGWKGTGGILTAQPITWKELRAIPGEPEKLRSYLEERITRQLTADPDSAVDVKEVMVQHLRQACVDVISGLPVSPEARASAYRILASLPDMRAEGEATDPLGRRGQALSYQEEAEPGLFTEIRLVVDPGAGRLLAQVRTNTTTLANGRQAELRHSTSYQVVDWTDERPELPARRD